MQHDNSQNANAHASEPRNKGKLIGAKLALHPTGAPTSNDLIIRDTYALSNNDARKFADWVAYRLTP